MTSFESSLPLVVVDEAHPARGGGVTVTPRIVVHEAPSPAFAVRMIFPDGREREGKASLDVAHIRGPQGAFALVRLHDLGVDDVPRGTKIVRL